MDFLEKLIVTIKSWSNLNSGFLTLILFITTLFLGWISGLFKSLIKGAKFKIQILPGPSFVCTFPTNRDFDGHKTHQTAIALYLRVRNSGNSPASISEIHVGYHNFTLKNTIKWFWLTNQTVALTDFQITIGENIKFYPFLIQQSFLLPSNQYTYLRDGENINGVVYFEQQESWGGFLPRVKNERVRLKIKIVDSFGGYHTTVKYAPFISLAKARDFNPSIGLTHETIKNKN